MASEKVTKTFSLTGTTDEMLSMLSRIDERPRSAELRFLIIRYAEEVLAGDSRARRDIKARLEALVDRAKSEVYEPEEVVEDIENGDLSGK